MDWDWVDPSLMSSIAGSSYRDLCCYGAGIAGTHPTWFSLFLAGWHSVYTVPLSWDEDQSVLVAFFRSSPDWLRAFLCLLLGSMGILLIG